MRRQSALFWGLGAGFAAIYLLDPRQGAVRRALVRDKVSRFANRGADNLASVGRDLRHRAQGSLASVRRQLGWEAVPNDVVIERVRSEVGRLVSHPHALAVRSDRGVVTVRGPILASERDQFLAAVRRVPGVRRVINEMGVYQSANNVPGMQGGLARS